MQKLLLLLLIITSFKAFAQNDYGFSEEWSQQYLKYNNKNISIFRSVSFSDSLNGIVIGNGADLSTNLFFRTTDGGNNWDHIKTDSSTFYKDSTGKSQYLHKSNLVREICYPDTSLFLSASCAMDGTRGSYVLRTTDRGETWSCIDLPDSAAIIKIKMRNKYEGIIIDPHGTIYHTSDSGDSWAPIGNMPVVPFRIQYRDGSFPEKDVFILLNNHYLDMGIFYILKSVDKGQTWEYHKVPENIEAYNMFFSDRNHGWVAGYRKNNDTLYSNVIYYTNDGGNSWIKQLDTINGRSSVSTNYELEFSDEKHGAAIGSSSGEVYLTSDGGNHWVDQCPNYSSHLYLNSGFRDASYMSPGRILLAGVSYSTPTQGLLLNYKKGPVNVVDEKLGINQKQWCFPNPVKGKARIEYSVEKTGAVHICLVDLTGRKILSLIDEENTIGSYNFEYDFSSLPSGTYLLRMETSDSNFCEKIIIE